MAVEVFLPKMSGHDDTIGLRPMRNLALSANYSVLDGVQGTRFLGEIKRLLETPALLL